MEIKISRRFTIEAAHFLPDYSGKCKNLHGHRFELFVEVKCREDQLQNGMVMDYAKLKEIVQSGIISIFDHRLLNDVLPFPVPTSENISIFIYNILADLIVVRTKGRVRLSKIILKETENSFCEIEMELPRFLAREEDILRE